MRQQSNSREARIFEHPNKTYTVKFVIPGLLRCISKISKAKNQSRNVPSCVPALTVFGPLVLWPKKWTVLFWLCYIIHLYTLSHTHNCLSEQVWYGFEFLKMHELPLIQLLAQDMQNWKSCGMHSAAASAFQTSTKLPHAKSRSGGSGPWTFQIFQMCIGLSCIISK